MFTNTTPINHFFLFQLNAHKMLYTNKYHKLHPACCSVCYTICRETFVLLGIKRSNWLQECTEWKTSKQPLLVCHTFLVYAFFLHMWQFSEMQSLNVMTVVWTEYSTHLQFIYTVKVSKGRVETLISSSTNQNRDIKCDLVGWVKVKIQCLVYM